MYTFTPHDAFFLGLASKRSDNFAFHVTKVIFLSKFGLNSMKIGQCFTKFQRKLSHYHGSWGLGEGLRGRLASLSPRKAWLGLGLAWLVQSLIVIDL